MADITIQPDEQGAYELPLKAGTVMTIETKGHTRIINPRLQILVHTADTPVYIRRGTTVTPRDPKANIITPGTWAELNTGDTWTIAATCASDATLSVTRT